MFGKTRITICREGLYYLVVLSFIVVGAIMREINLLVVIAGMMMAPVFINLRMAIATLHRLTVTRRLPKTICAGDLLVVDVVISNARKWLSSWALVAEDRVEREGGDASADRQRVELFLPYLATGETGSLSYRGRLMTRGRYRFGPLQVSTRFPLGLVRRTATFPATDTLLVCPRLGHMTPAWHAELRAEHAGTRSLQSRRGLTEGDFFGLRDWRAGDSRRWIHWRTSARRGSLSVREFERQNEQNLILLADLWLPDDPTPEQLDNLELAISFAATAVAEQCRRGSSRLWFATAGGTATVFQGASSAAMSDEVLSHLALVQAGTTPPLAELLARGLRFQAAGERLMVISSRGLSFTRPSRMADLPEDPAALRALQQCLTIDSGSDELGRYFDFE
jgi:uncharacterized protein (DUF58 family)